MVWLQLQIPGVAQPLAGVARQGWTRKFTDVPGEGVDFTLTSLCEKDDEDRTFVSAQNYHAITRRHDLERDWGDIASGQEWWLLADLPDTEPLALKPLDGREALAETRGEIC